MILNLHNSLDIFEMTVSTNELVVKSVNKELLVFKRLQVDPKEIKWPSEWWQKHEFMFPIVGFFARQILRIVGSHKGFFL
jgi:hypothetical protein